MVDTARRSLLVLFALLFLFAAYVQLNDADPALWVSIYAAAAAISGLAAADRLPASVAALGTAAATLAAVTLAWQLAAASSWQPMHPDRVERPVGLLETEKGREMLGLVLVASACALGWWTSTHTRSSKDRDPPA